MSDYERCRRCQFPKALCAPCLRCAAERAGREEAGMADDRADDGAAAGEPSEVQFLYEQLAEEARLLVRGRLEELRRYAAAAGHDEVSTALAQAERVAEFGLWAATWDARAAAVRRRLREL